MLEKALVTLYDISELLDEGCTRITTANGDVILLAIDKDNLQDKIYADYYGKES